MQDAELPMGMRLRTQNGTISRMMVLVYLSYRSNCRISQAGPPRIERQSPEFKRLRKLIRSYPWVEFHSSPMQLMLNRVSCTSTVSKITAGGIISNNEKNVSRRLDRLNAHTEIYMLLCQVRAWEISPAFVPPALQLDNTNFQVR